MVVGGGCVVGANRGEKSHSGCADLKAASPLLKMVASLAGSERVLSG